LGENKAMDDLLNEFLTETAESLAVIDVELVQFEQDPGDKQILGNIFRLVHTIKGTCGFLGLGRLEAIAHAGENVLGKFRDGLLPVTPAAVTSILACIDAIRRLLAALERTGSEPAGDDGALIAELNAVAEGRPPVAAEAADVRPVTGDAGFPVAAELLAEVAEAESAGVRAASDEQIAAECAAERASAAAHVTGPAAGLPVSRPVADPGPAVVADEGAIKDAREPSIAAQTIRVSVDTLENLMTLVSELVLTRNQLLQMVRGRQDNGLGAPLQRLSHITSELQEGVMKTRMQPIGNAWAKLPRIVRDLSLETGKKLDLKMIGAATELDRQVLELIKDPLTHMVRNSADHGIEHPDDRRRAGKPETGTITLNAYHEGGHIIIEIGDDGRGLDSVRIREKIVAQGLCSAAELAALADEQVYSFIFRPGFSTAEKVTSVSGRGVGMDVVRTNIEKIGGTIELKSAKGVGTTFIIKIPLTLAIVSALIVGCGGQRFAVPQIAVRELVRATAGGETRIETIHGSPLLRLRDRLLPLIDLHRLLDLATPAGDVGTADGVADPFVVVTQLGNVTFGVIVDEVFDTEEIVVKPVASVLRSIPCFAGNTILGDGSVIMILDPNGMVGTLGQKVTQVSEDVEASVRDPREKTRLLVFRAGGSTLKAVPLQLVARLEQVDLSRVEMSQSQHVIQYRDHLMPLVPLAASFDWNRQASVPTLVFNDGGRSMGLVVDEIVDVVEMHLAIEVAAEGEGLVGSAIVDGKATDLIDVSHFLTKAYPSWFEPAEGRSFGEITVVRDLLLVEDSAFFRDLLVPVLEAAGWRVTAVADALHALRLRDDGREFDVIVSDIEMPGLNGFEFAEKVTRDGRWSSTPLIALSSYTSDRDFARGRSAGFADYVAKFDREGLMLSLESRRRCDAGDRRAA
jgi:two-component system chemotaxis sensor kinase CheA